MIQHPDYPGFVRRLQNIRSRPHPFTGTVYRFISPKYSKPADVVNGVGGLHASGRWNLKGSCRISYTSIEPEISLAESLAQVRYFRLPISKALPRTLVSIEAKLQNVLDLTDGRFRQRLRLAADRIRGHNWRKANRSLNEALTQAWGRAFFEQGYEAVLVPSSASPGSNLIIFPDNLGASSSFIVTP